jgi:hypothetical protein
MCTACERRTRPDAPPLCPKCWDLRTATVQDTAAKESRKLQIGGLLLGVFSFLHPLVMVASLILNIRELRRGTGGDSRWMNTAGLVLTGLAIVTWTVGIVAVLASH